MNNAKSRNILIAGMGNIFLGDDAFGVEVARRLFERALPSNAVARDFGIRGIDLAYALTTGYDEVILVDVVQRGGRPGTIYLIQPHIAAGGTMETHEIGPGRALAIAKGMGANLDNVRIVGCEPESFGTEEEPQMELSPAVGLAVIEAVALIESIVSGRLEAEHA